MRAPYLSLPDDGARPTPLGKSGGLAVGLVWDVGAWDKRRVIPAELLRSLAGDGITLYSLQRGPGADRLARRVHGTSVRPTSSRLGISSVGSISSFASTRWLRTWRARWDAKPGYCCMPIATGAGLLRKSRTFWYPSLRLFYQKNLGQWDGVVEEVRQALLARAELKRTAA